MPRLKFDLKPVVSEWRTERPEEHNAWVREVYANHYPDETPTACDCGYWADDLLVTCPPDDRERCKATVEKRLEAHYRRIHLAGLKEKRKWPGDPHPRLGAGKCCWCGGDIVHGRTYQRHCHDGRADEPDCKHMRQLHTEIPAQRHYLIGRDGIGCFTCNQVVGAWWRGHEVDPAHRRRISADWARWYPEETHVGVFCPTSYNTGLEVDHFIALACAFEAFQGDYRRRWFFGPRNLRLLCRACHVAKTGQDRALLREIYTNGPAWGRHRIIEILGAAGLLKTGA